MSWGKGTTNNSIGWGKGADNNGIGWGSVYPESSSGDTDIQSGLSNTVAPVISGTNEVGETLSCTSGTWSGGTPITYAYQWKRDGVSIGSATNSTYLLISADAETDITCTVTATNAEGSNSATSNTITIAADVDADAQAFITAASITDTTQQSAVNQLVLDLKAASIWAKMKAVYPMVGGSSTAHSYNLRNTAQYQLTFGGGVIHDSNGTAGNGVNSYATTGLNAQSVLTNSNLHLSWYSRSASTAGAFSCEIQADSNYAASNWVTFRVCDKTSGNAYFSAGDDSVAATVSQTQNGFFVGSETANNLRKMYRNGSVIATNTTTDTNALPNLGLSFWGSSVPLASNFSANGCSFASIGDGLSDAEVSNLYTAVQTFNTTLSRNV